MWTGPGGAPAAYRSSEFSSRAFCPTCGSTLGAIDDAPVVALVTGVFDKPSLAALKPVAHSFKGQRPRWWHVEIDELSARHLLSAQILVENAAATSGQTPGLGFTNRGGEIPLQLGIDHV